MSYFRAKMVALDQQAKWETQETRASLVQMDLLDVLEKRYITVL